MCSDELSLRYSDLVTGSYDCVDRIVLNAFFPLGHNPGGIRVWWRRWHDDSDAELDNTHLMRMAGRFAVYQLEYSRNLIFADGHRMQQVFDSVVDRTRSRLDVPKIRTIFGAARRPCRTRKNSSTIEAAIETPTFDLTVFKLHFGRLTGKAFTKGERVLRFEAIAHHTAQLRCGRMIEKVSRNRDPTGRHRRTVRHRPGLRGHRIPRRRHP
ncbi:hypothetical protein JNN96_34845 [Mycobacterium sp. DSM 3803]|nr:hypothetical protein [Mycobacterium sp. DSM 3803]